MVEDRVLVVHGGISNRFSLRRLMAVLRSGERTEQATTHTGVTDQEVIADVLWSDPNNCPGCTESERGIGFQFGPDVTRDFLLPYGLGV